MRVAYWDLETWDLSAEFGPIICASVLDYGAEEMRSFRMDTYLKKGLAEDMTDDHALVVDVRDYLETFHITCGYFSKGFDLAHLRTRLVLHGERPFHKRFHFDPIWGFKGWRGLKPRSSKMKHVANFLNLEQKPDVDAEVWMKAKGGNKKALDEVVERCEADVRITAAIAERCCELDLLSNIQKY